MMVRAAPSVSAHSLMSPVAADLLRKLIVLVLAMAAMAVGRAQQILTLIGISMACMVILANLGSRAWHFMRWKPQKYEGYGASLLAYARAVLTGIFFPYMGNRNIEVGGKASIEYVIRTAFFSAVAFIISDIDAIQQFLVVGSEVSRCYSCEQHKIIGHSFLTPHVLFFSSKELRSKYCEFRRRNLVVCFTLLLSNCC